MKLPEFMKVAAEHERRVAAAVQRAQDAKAAAAEAEKEYQRVAQEAVKFRWALEALRDAGVVLEAEEDDASASAP